MVPDPEEKSALTRADIEAEESRFPGLLTHRQARELADAQLARSRKTAFSELAQDPLVAVTAYLRDYYPKYILLLGVVALIRILTLTVLLTAIRYLLPSQFLGDNDRVFWAVSVYIWLEIFAFFAKQVEARRFK